RSSFFARSRECSQIAENDSPATSALPGKPRMRPAGVCYKPRPMTARIHHYVPQLYLNSFCCDLKREQLFVIDAVEKQSFQTRPRNVAAERDFNRVDIDGLPPDALEVAFNAFETEVAASIERTSERRHLRDADDRSAILNLIGLMAIRNPRWRGKMKDFHH